MRGVVLTVSTSWRVHLASCSAGGPVFGRARARGGGHSRDCMRPRALNYPRHKSQNSTLSIRLSLIPHTINLSPLALVALTLQHALKRMGIYERHPSVTEQAVSTTWKIALALFINSACVVLLVNLPESFSVRSEDRWLDGQGVNENRGGQRSVYRTKQIAILRSCRRFLVTSKRQITEPMTYIPSTLRHTAHEVEIAAMRDTSRDITHNRPPSLLFARAFEPTKILGSSDASRTALEAREAADSTEWYTTTGQALITTIAINVVAPRAPDLVEYLILGPWRRRPASAAAMITQRQLNKNWKGGQTTLPVVPAGAVALDITYGPYIIFFSEGLAMYCMKTNWLAGGTRNRGNA